MHGVFSSSRSHTRCQCNYSHRTEGFGPVKLCISTSSTQTCPSWHNQASCENHQIRGVFIREQLHYYCGINSGQRTADITIPLTYSTRYLVCPLQIYQVYILLVLDVPNSWWASKSNNNNGWGCVMQYRYHHFFPLRLPARGAPAPGPNSGFRKNHTTAVQSLMNNPMA